MTKINLKPTESAVIFDEVQWGSMFIWSGELYLKSGLRVSGIEFNAVNLSSKEFAEFKGPEPVRKVTRVDVFID